MWGTFNVLFYEEQCVKLKMINLEEKNWQRWWKMSKTLSGRTGITFLPQRYYESNKEKLSNRQTEKYPQEMVISPSSDFREGWVSQMLVLSLSCSLVVNLQRRRLSKPEAWNALIILFFSPFSFSYSCQKKNVSFLFFPNCVSDLCRVTRMYQGLDKRNKTGHQMAF